MVATMMKVLRLSIILGVLSAIGIKMPATHAQTFSWSLSSDQNASQFNNTDAPPGTGLDSQGNFWYVYSDCAGHPHWYTYKGTSMDNLTQQHVFDTASLPQPYDDDEYWISGMWIDPSTQTWWAIVHVEFLYDQWGYDTDWRDHFRRIALAKSTNKGQSWTLEGDIITPELPTIISDSVYPGDTFHFGNGDPHLYVDTTHGYFYIFYSTKEIYKATGYASTGDSIMAARAPISGKMAPGTWTKWHNGGWNQPGLGGAESEVAVGNTFAVSWNPYLGKFLAVDNMPPGCFYTCTDLSTQNWVQNWWGNTQIFAQTSGPSAISWYNWTADTASTLNHQTTSDCFRLYSANNNAQFNTKYMWVTLGNSSHVPPLNNSHYYQIIDKASGMALAVKNASTSNGAQIVKATPGSGYEQQWRFADQGNGYYFIFNRASELVLDVSTPVLARGQNIVQSTINAAACNQQWALMPTSGGYHKFFNRNTRVIGITGSNAIIYDEYFGAQDQEFRFVQK